MNSAGIALAAITVSTFINSLAYIYLKKAHIRVEKQGFGSSNRTWESWIGITLMVIAGIINLGKLNVS